MEAVVQPLLANTSTQAFFSPGPEDVDTIRAILSSSHRNETAVKFLHRCFIWLTCLRSPIGDHIHNQIMVLCIVGLEMHCIIMWSIHAGVHHKDTGFNCRAFARLEYHLPDG